MADQARSSSKDENALAEIEVVPGTEIMRDVGSQRFQKSDRLHTVLIPQPSSDPKDPLNWSRWRKAVTIAAATTATFSQTVGPLAIAPILPELAKEFYSDMEGVVQFTGITIIVLCFTNFMWVPLSETFGRRFVLLASTLINIASCIWRAKATSYSAFMGSSVLVGFGAAPSEVLQPAIVADIMFLHERGFYNTLYFSFFFGGIMLGPIIQGAMAQTVGWRSFWWLNVAITCFTFLVVLVALPETKFSREKSETTQSRQLSEKISGDQPSIPNDSDTDLEIDPSVHRGGPQASQFHIFQIPNNFLPTFLGAFLTPWKLLVYPIVEFAAFVVGFSSTCYLMITFVQAEAFAEPPYNFSPLAIGFTNFASLGGALIGLATAGPASDWISSKLTRRNGGIREPEMRLVTMIPYVVIMLIGNFVTAFGLENKWDWRAVVIIGFGFAGIQIAALPSIAITYAIDSYKPAATSVLLAATINKNLWGYGVSRFITSWVVTKGFVPPFMLNMGLLFVWCSFGVLLWFWGKRLRMFTSKSTVHQL